jgi:hypothetical protein
VFHRGPPPMFPMGPRGEFGPGPGGPGGPGGGPGGPRFELPQPGEANQPGPTATPSRP